jgi:hypothetical protein
MLHNLGIPVVDASVNGEEYTCLPDDAHPNALANRIYAEKIRDYLSQYGTSPPATLPDHQTESLRAVAKRLSTDHARCSDLAAQIRDAPKHTASWPSKKSLPPTASSPTDGIVQRPSGHTESDLVLLGKQVYSAPSTLASKTGMSKSFS